ncbi:PTS mannitol transporter subunit IICB [Alloiococcus sp. CFN-8]|uniref:PTS mannitol transporter subunit IICB n=1 Tax=Alloiococcus sp. CFN-8 TaxID=3416081 RepID=UPI003CF1F1AB
MNSKAKSKSNVQGFGNFLSGMIMPNIGAIIAWGLITTLFIGTGWLPNKELESMVSPMLTYIIPGLIAYQGGKLVGGNRGAVMGIIAATGVIVGSDYVMFLGAMIIGPVAGWVIKKFDEAVEGKVKAGFEMLVNNFSIGILGMILAIIGYYLVGPFMGAILSVLDSGVQFMVKNSILPLVAIFVEPAKVLFLNNAINHGVFTPLAVDQVAEAGKSIMYLIETNPGPGLGVLLAYWMFSKDKVTKTSAPGAIIIHFFGGIHEIYFPYILMNPILLLSTIGGSLAALLYYTIFNLGLAGPASPGSILAYLGMAPKGSTIAVLFGAVIAAAVSFVISIPLIKRANKKSSNLEDATMKIKEMKAESKGLGNTPINKIIFACDAGMGSSAMGATVLKKKLKEAGLSEIEVEHASVSEIPKDAKLVVVHKDLAERAAKSAPEAKLVTITNFMAAPEYDMVVDDLKKLYSQIH